MNKKTHVPFPELYRELGVSRSKLQRALKALGVRWREEHVKKVKWEGYKRKVRAIPRSEIKAIQNAFTWLEARATQSSWRKRKIKY